MPGVPESTRARRSSLFRASARIAARQRSSLLILVVDHIRQCAGCRHGEWAQNYCRQSSKILGVRASSEPVTGRERSRCLIALQSPDQGPESASGDRLASSIPIILNPLRVPHSQRPHAGLPNITAVSGGINAMSRPLCTASSEQQEETETDGLLTAIRTAAR